jgi:hypothetical protein
MRLWILIGLIFVANILQPLCLSQDKQDENSINGLFTQLDGKDYDTRKKVLDELIKKLPDKEIRQRLIEEYKKQTKNFEYWIVSTNISRNWQRELILDVLIKDNTEDVKDFIYEAFMEEIRILRGANKYEAAGYYPHGLFRICVDFIVMRCISEDKFQRIIKEAACDKTLHFTDRQELTALDIRVDMMNKNITDINKKVIFLAEKINPINKNFIPWDVYNAGSEARMAWGRTEEVKRKDKGFGEFIRSEEGIYEIGLELALERLGRKAVDPIILLMDKKDMPQDKKYFLISSVARILYVYAKNDKEWNEKDQEMYKKLETLVNSMEDFGCFDRKYYAQQDIKAIKLKRCQSK